MRQKKSKTLFYIIGLIAVLAVLFLFSREVPMQIEHVEQPLANDFVSGQD
ncbi:MAG: hypothetical protein J6L86_08225 [Alphaproteobacteria bacterium]|nr:hypothetical protein [Alphaproteobacteria bacterium]MBQ8631737.1 hypothetical protein [Alphaproteobacteria bacterium]MDY4840966.1 hypothetical protein [Alphaproteobacteria bacterium]